MPAEWGRPASSANAAPPLKSTNTKHSSSGRCEAARLADDRPQQLALARPGGADDQPVRPHPALGRLLEVEHEAVAVLGEPDRRAQLARPARRSRSASRTSAARSMLVALSSSRSGASSRASVSAPAAPSSSSSDRPDAVAGGAGPLEHRRVRASVATTRSAASGGSAAPSLTRQIVRTLSRSPRGGQLADERQPGDRRRRRGSRRARAAARARRSRSSAPSTLEDSIRRSCSSRGWTCSSSSRAELGGAEREQQRRRGGRRGRARGRGSSARAGATSASPSRLRAAGSKQAMIRRSAGARNAAAWAIIARARPTTARALAGHGHDAGARQRRDDREVVDDLVAAHQRPGPARTARAGTRSSGPRTERQLERARERHRRAAEPEREEVAVGRAPLPQVAAVARRSRPAGPDPGTGARRPRAGRLVTTCEHALALGEMGPVQPALGAGGELAAAPLRDQ